MISGYKYVLFDVDGVILSSIDYYLGLFRDIAETLGASEDIPDEFYKRHIGVKIMTWMVQIIPAQNHDRIKGCFFEKNTDSSEHHQFPLIEGTKETLLRIKRNNQNSCFISSKTRASLDVMIRCNHLASLLDYSISGDEVKNFKPDPEGIIRSLEHFNGGPGEAVFIGDSLHDLGAARNGNVAFVEVLSGICSKTDWQREEVPYVSSVKDLYSL
jgi:phosphoglycolate phosphatase-like HAD superfamily hydrolase